MLTQNDPSTEPRPFRWAALLILALLLAVAGAATQRLRPRPAWQLLTQGDAQRTDYRYLSAVESYRQAAQVDIRDADALLRLGEVYLEMRQYVDAADAFAAASQRAGNTPAIHTGLAHALEGNGDLSGATEHWQSVIASQPDNLPAHFELARLSAAQARLDEAQLALNEVLEKQPDNTQAHFSLGQWLALDQPDQARRHFLTAFNNPAYALSATDWLNAVGGSDDPAYRAAQIGRLLLADGQQELARRAFERAVELNPTYAEARAYLGYMLDPASDEASALFAQAVAQAPDSVIVYYLLGQHLRRRGDTAGARAAFETALKRDPTNAALAVEIGLLILEQPHGLDYIESERWLVKAAELEPDNPAWAKQLARFYLNHLLNVQEKAIPAAQQAVYLDGLDAEAHDLMGWAYYLSGEMPFARSELQRALELNPRDAAAHYHMAVVLTALGQPAQARLSAERAASLDKGGLVGQKAKEILER